MPTRRGRPTVTIVLSEAERETLERWFAELTTKWLRRSAHRSVAELTGAVRRWVADWNADPRPFVWHKTAGQIFDNLAGYLNRIPDSGH